jgi:GR25 family glycosyltransferase involved in LPS biosynthesis
MAYNQQPAFVVGTSNRPHRQSRVAARLRAESIAFEWWVNPPDLDDPERGCFDAHVSLAAYSLRRGLSSILVFEDDAVLEPGFAGVFSAAREQIPGDWLTVHFCPNTHRPLKRYSDNLFVAEEVLCTACIAYNLPALESFVGFSRWKHSDLDLPIDMVLSGLQHTGRCFVAYPLVCSQEPGHSSIIGKPVDYSFIKERYAVNVKG